MKKVLLIACLVLFNKAYSQQDTLEKVAHSICDCLAKNKKEVQSETEFEAIITKCIMDSAGEFVFSKIANADGNGDQRGYEFGKQIGIELVKIGCKSFIDMSVKVAEGKKPNTSNENSIKSAEGEILAVEEKDFLNLTIKTSAGRTYNFIYYSYVPGSDAWIKTASISLKGKKVKVSWKENETYQPKAKDFITVKEITALEFL